MASVTGGMSQRQPAPEILAGPYSHMWHFLSRAVALLLLGIALSLPGKTYAIDLIAHESVPMNQLTLRELRAIFAMRMDQWDNGQRVQVFVLPQQNDVHQRFSKSVMQVLPHQLQAAWYRLVYSGMGKGPVEVQSEQEMMERIRSTPGAIGYLESFDAVSGEDPIKKIKVLP